jgi:hypothetical protein
MSEVVVTIHTVGMDEETRVLLLHAVEKIVLESEYQTFAISLTPLDGVAQTRVSTG